MAGGDAVLLIYRIKPSNSINPIRLIGRVEIAKYNENNIRVPDVVYDVAVDKERRIAYAADGANGIAIIDISNPIQPDHICSLLDVNNDNNDDRILGRLTVGTLGSETTLIVDSETGLLYTGQYGVNSAQSGLAVTGARKPRMEFLLEVKDAMGMPTGKYQVAKNYLSAFNEDQPKLALWINGGAGATISDTTLTLFDRKGFKEEPAKNSQGMSVPTTVERTGVILARKSAKKTERDFNLYIQQDRTTLMMNYDPAKENPMVTRQGGTLKGSVKLNGGNGYGPNGWAGTVEINKPVSRPWIEWIYNNPSSPPTERGEAKSYTGPNQTHTYFPVDEWREVKLKVHKMVGNIEVAPSENDWIKITAEPAGAVEGLPITVKYLSPLFRVRAVGNPQTFKFKYEFVENNADGGGQEAQSFKVELGMDYNRDGNIDNTDFNYEKSAENKNREYLFWVNNDSDNKAFLSGWEDDEENSGDDNDANDKKISCKRDLEDFTRLQIRVDNLTAEKKQFNYYFKIEPIEGNTPPSLNLFEAAKWNQFYLNPDLSTNPSEIQKVTEQLSKKTLAVIDQISHSPATINFQETENHDKIAPYLLEGKTAGKGKIVLIVKGKDQWGNEVDVYTRETTIKLTDITDFYDHYVLKIDNEENDMPKSTYETRRCNYSPEGEDYILFVHGWNMEDYKIKRWAETAFKRLWWQGYKGKFGLFSWPCLKISLWPWEWLYEYQRYDRSEIRAWRSSDALKSVLTEVKPAGGKLCVLGHSQGNITIGEAIRKSDAGIVYGYLAFQAALSRNFYDPAETHPDPIIYPPPNDDMPDVYSKCPFNKCPIPTTDGDPPPLPYFADNAGKVQVQGNYFNETDYALSKWWEIVNNRKPEDSFLCAGHVYDYQYIDGDGNPNSYNPQNGDRFVRIGAGDIVHLSFCDQDNIYEIYSTCAETQSTALGSITNPALTGFNRVFDLHRDSVLSYQDVRLDHDKEFLSNINDQWRFYSKVLEDLGFQVSGQ